MTASLSNLIPPGFYYLTNLVSSSFPPVVLMPRVMYGRIFIDCSQNFGSKQKMTKSSVHVRRMHQHSNQSDMHYWMQCRSNVATAPAALIDGIRHDGQRIGVGGEEDDTGGRKGGGGGTIQLRRC